MFDPESKVKYMLDGLANIILRPNMDGLLTDYQKMKIGKYEIPISSCASLFSDELYSERPKIDNGEEELRMNMMMDELSRKYDEAAAAKTKKNPKARKTFSPTRRQKIESARKTYGITHFEFARVNTANEFYFDGGYYRIPESCASYAPKLTEDGDTIYDMDQILCGKDGNGYVFFFDMNIEPVGEMKLIAEQTKF